MKINIRIEKLADRSRYFAYNEEDKDLGYLVIQNNLNSKAEQITAFRIYKPENRNLGIGSSLMKQMLEDYKGKNIIVIPMPYDENDNISDEDLKLIYKKFGFKQHPKYNYVMFLNN